MLSFEQNRAVVGWLRRHSALPLVALELWPECLQRSRHDKGEIPATCDELAAAVEADPDEVSRVMSELESIGAIARARERVAGMRGPGRARYWVYPRVDAHLAGRSGTPRHRARSTRAE